ncbi:MAG: nuclear transport factor 2 family protein [Gammaproteobacteria bacterium]
MTLEQQVRRLVDRDQIKELIARYAHAIAHARGDEVAAMFTEDGEFYTRYLHPARPATEVRGHAALRRYMGGLKPGQAIPCIHNFVIEIDGDRAKSTCSLEVRTVADGRSFIGSGYYDDTLRRVDGQWRFAVRDATFFHFVPLDEGWA